MQRFAILNEDELKRIIDEKESSNTQKINEVSFGVLLKYCEDKKNQVRPFFY